MTQIPYPGKPVRGSTTGKPIMALFDLLGHRWAMGVLWQLSLGGPCTFRQLQERCETISPAVLNSRIKELTEARLLKRSKEGYQTTELGTQIIAAIFPLKDLAEQWVNTLNESAEKL